jgi:hypothetical protein
MIALAALQRDFARSVLDAATDADEGVAIYRSSVAANFAAALAATYPVVARLVGATFFAEAARRYVASTPSRSGDLADLGAGFAQFLASYPHAASLAYLADVARLEWACHESERAPEPAPFDFTTLAGVPPEAHGEIRFVLHPAVRLLESPFPIAAIHGANAPDRDGTPDRTQGADFVLVRRVEARAVVESLPEGEWRFLESVARGETLRKARGFTSETLARYVATHVLAGFTAPRCAR